MNALTDGQADGWTDGRMRGWKKGRAERWTGERMDRHVNEWMDKKRGKGKIGLEFCRQFGQMNGALRWVT